jgi:CDP-paratose 2-epimerase
MKVLVTGGCGFLGSHICEFYKRRGDEAVSFDNLTKYELMRTGYKVRGARLHNWNILKGMGVSLVKGDIRNREKLFEAAKGCDYIVHTAAQPAMTIAIEEPYIDLDNNVVGTFNVLDAARKYDVPVTSCSTVHIYGNDINKTIKEGKTRFVRDPAEIAESQPVMQGSITPLHASKRTGEIYAQAFMDTYGLKAGVFRLTGMYGPRQFGGEDHGWVANFAIRTLLRLPIKVFGTDKQVRDILYVKDAVAAFDAFYNHQDPDIYNIGGGASRIISISECLNMLKEITGQEQDITLEPARKGDLWYFASDITKAKENLKWEPKYSNEEGIRSLVGWAKENLGMFRG